MILSCLVYDGKFSSVTIYKVGKCMMPNVLKIIPPRNILLLFTVRDYFSSGKMVFNLLSSTSSLTTPHSFSRFIINHSFLGAYCFILYIYIYIYFFFFSSSINN